MTLVPSGPRWAARCGVLGRARMPAYERVLRPCLAVAHRTPTTKAIMNRALSRVRRRRRVLGRRLDGERRVRPRLACVLRAVERLVCALEDRRPVVGLAQLGDAG